MGFLNRIVHIENIRLKPITAVCVFTHDLYWSNPVDVLTPNVHHSWGQEQWRNPVKNSAEGATYISHGCSPWSQIPNTCPSFGRKDANWGNEDSPKRLDDDFSPRIYGFFEPHSSHREHKTKPYGNLVCLHRRFILVECG